MTKTRVLVSIDEVIVDGVTAAVPHPALVRHALEHEVRRLIARQPVGSWQAGARDRVQAAPAPIGPTTPVGELTHAIATRIVSAAVVGPTEAPGGKS